MADQPIISSSTCTTNDLIPDTPPPHIASKRKRPSEDDEIDSAGARQAAKARKDGQYDRLLELLDALLIKSWQAEMNSLRRVTPGRRSLGLRFLNLLHELAGVAEKIFPDSPPGRTTGPIKKARWDWVLGILRERRDDQRGRKRGKSWKWITEDDLKITVNEYHDEGKVSQEVALNMSKRELLGRYTTLQEDQLEDSMSMSMETEPEWPPSDPLVLSDMGYFEDTLTNSSDWSLHHKGTLHPIHNQPIPVEDDVTTWEPTWRLKYRSPFRDDNFTTLKRWTLIVADIPSLLPYRRQAISRISTIVSACQAHPDVPQQEHNSIFFRAREDCLDRYINCTTRFLPIGINTIEKATDDLGGIEVPRIWSSSLGQIQVPDRLGNYGPDEAWPGDLRCDQGIRRIMLGPERLQGKRFHCRLLDFDSLNDETSDDAIRARICQKEHLKMHTALDRYGSSIKADLIVAPAGTQHTLDPTVHGTVMTLAAGFMLFAAQNGIARPTIGAWQMTFLPPHSTIVIPSNVQTVCYSLTDTMTFTTKWEHCVLLEAALRLYVKTPSRNHREALQSMHEKCKRSLADGNENNAENIQLDDFVNVLSQVDHVLASVPSQ